MHRLIAVAVISFAAAFVASALAGASFYNILWIVPVTSSLSIAGWAGALILADATYRPRADAAATMQGVCPECRTFNSLKEVTSADPSHRRVDCQACKESYRVEMTNSGVVARRLGKVDESE